MSFVHIVISVCPPLCLHVRARVHGASVYVHFLLRFSVYLYLCVCFHATGRGGLVSLSIDKAARLRLLMGWCDKDSLPRSVCVYVCASVCRVRVQRQDRCGSNHPTGAVWSPITLFKQTAQPDTQTRRCLTDYWITSRPVRNHSVRSHARYDQIIVNNPVTVIVWLKQSRALGVIQFFLVTPSLCDVLMNGLISGRMSYTSYYLSRMEMTGAE